MEWKGRAFEEAEGRKVKQKRPQADCDQKGSDWFAVSTETNTSAAHSPLTRYHKLRVDRSQEAGKIVGRSLCGALRISTIMYRCRVVVVGAFEGDPGCDDILLPGAEPSDIRTQYAHEAVAVWTPHWAPANPSSLQTCGQTSFAEYTGISHELFAWIMGAMPQESNARTALYPIPGMVSAMVIQYPRHQI
ncbi:hypothetical protein BDU57DRAFT_534150 [Ampelomyces quisqualis]|uniref:Uncharacterized protein n=1 Tax=Ampelomyces quisqualis TaxID=50730 RepID=A0A6A5QY49_AMPQU|nr:hypothetical protein BDU57DRAFT_534150 [Ampelomyces quisqualis]